MSGDPDIEEVTGLLHEDTARRILTATCTEHMSATELHEYCDVSRPTVYRWLERLEAAGLISERSRPRPDGHHDTVYVATFERLTVELRDDGLDVEVERTEATALDDRADWLTNMWEEL